MANHVHVNHITVENKNNKLGYVLKNRWGQPARPYNDPASGENSNQLLAHDWTHHSFKMLDNYNLDEIAAMGLQIWAKMDFVSIQGTSVGNNLSYQLHGFLKEHNWDYNSFLSPFKTLNNVCLSWIKDSFEDSMHELLLRIYEDKFGTFFGELALYADAPIDLPNFPTDEQQEHLIREIGKLFTHGANHGKFIYKEPIIADYLFNEIANQLLPYTENVTIDSPDLKLYVNIHKQQVEVVPVTVTK